MVTRFEVLLELRSRPDGQLVSFKQDGRRFINATTVKLCVDHSYTLNLNLRPPRKLTGWQMEGADLTFKEVDPPPKAQDMAAYTAVWSTDGFSVTKKGNRYDLGLHLQLEDDLVLNTSMQVKFYSNADRTASKWGQPMRLLDLSCDSVPGQNYVTVRRGSIL